MVQYNRVTIKDIAKNVGVSNTSVSMALRNTGNLSDAVRKKIIQVAKEMGYEKNYTASKLRSKYSHTIGIIIGDFSDIFSSTILKFLTNEIAKDDYVINIYQCNNKRTLLDSQIKKLMTQKVDGIFLCLDETVQYSMIDFSSLDIPVINLSKVNYFSNMIDYIGIDHELSGKVVTEYLINQGHRKIAYLGGASNSFCRAERLAGFYKTLNAFSLSSEDCWILPSDLESFSKDIQKLIKADSSISALICHDFLAYNITFGVIKSLGRKIGFDQIMGRNISLIYYSDTVNPPISIPSLAITSDMENIGIQAWKRFIESNNYKKKYDKSEKLSYQMLLPSKVFYNKM